MIIRTFYRLNTNISNANILSAITKKFNQIIGGYDDSS